MNPQNQNPIPAVSKWMIQFATLLIVLGVLCLLWMFIQGLSGMMDEMDRAVNRGYDDTRALGLALAFGGGFLIPFSLVAIQTYWTVRIRRVLKAVLESQITAPPPTA